LFIVCPELFVCVPCARPSWPFCQLLTVRKYIVSYRNFTCILEITGHAVVVLNLLVN